MHSFRLHPAWPALLISAFFPAALLGEEAKPPARSEAAVVADANAAFLADLVQKLSPKNQRAFGEMLAADWKDRPEWADMLIALLKRDPVNLGVGWFQPGVPKYDWKWLAEKLDADKDDVITKDELPKDVPYPELFLSRLDRDGDGELRPVDFEHFIRQPPTPPQMLSQFLATVVDADTNGRITADELQSWFKAADKEKGGFLTLEDLVEHVNRSIAELSKSGEAMPGPDEMLAMFFRGELGMWTTGPKPGAEAPDFTLPTHDGKQTVTLSKSRGKPVVLIFGSFT